MILYITWTGLSKAVLTLSKSRRTKINDNCQKHNLPRLKMNSDNYVFKRKGNEEQFKVNSKVANKMKEARCFLREDPEQTEQTQKAAQSISEVTEYETHSLADDSEDEKRIIRAENKAARKIKDEKQSKQHRSTPYSTSQSSRFNSNAPRNNVPVQRPGKCYECGIPGHWRVDHQTGAFGATMQRNKIYKISKMSRTSERSKRYLKKMDTDFKYNQDYILRPEVQKRKLQQNAEKLAEHKTWRELNKKHDYYCKGQLDPQPALQFQDHDSYCKPKLPRPAAD
ncbi:unnamed protein product [Mytilus edulis]|uniref:CCHC-type domain-containing protein n=1 Tax=Mytilus edulis TaxID=6550 RepID=A0A8S3UC78_MYTED|nr:unnamed protein product [Mytilus edulis]